MTGVFLLGAVRCNAQIFRKKKKVNKSTSAENTAEPDKILYDKATEDVRRGRHEVGRLNLQTLINTYPDSEYLAKAKLSIADSFFKESGKANMTQAIQAYKDFVIFFPFMKANRELWRMGQIWEGTERKKFAPNYYAEIVRTYTVSILVTDAKELLKARVATVPHPDPKAVAWMTAEQNAPRPRTSLVKKPM